MTRRFFRLDGVGVVAALLLASFGAWLDNTHINTANAPLAYNVKTFAAVRGADGRMLAALEELERLSDSAQTVYVYNSPEYMLAWHYAMWAPRRPGVCDLGPSPQATPKFKWVSFSWPITANPGWTKEHYVVHVKAELDCAFDKGYRVIAAPLGRASSRSWTAG